MYCFKAVLLFYIVMTSASAMVKKLFLGARRNLQSRGVSTRPLFFSSLLNTDPLIRTKRNCGMCTQTSIPLLTELNKEYQIILGSASPRRLELLNLMGLKDIKVCVSGFEEGLEQSNFETAADYCLETAKQKCEYIINKSMITTSKKSILIGADTVVVCNEKLLEKPKNRIEAYEMLSMLNNAYHIVHTGVVIYTNIDNTKTSLDNSLDNAYLPFNLASSFLQSTKVKFIKLSDKDISAYIDSGEPFDKAGGYGIQGLGGQFVDSIEGCYFNVMGLPISTLSRQLVDVVRCED